MTPTHAKSMAKHR